MRELAYLETTGSAYERGRQQGAACADRIEATFQKWPYKSRGNAEQEAIVATCQRFLRLNFPEILEEIEGIAQGANLPFPDVFWLSAFNALPHVPAWKGVPRPPQPAQQCTGVVIKGDKGLYLGKSSDINEEQREQYLLLKATTETGMSYLSVRWVGTAMTEVGINSFGLAAGANSGPTIAEGQVGYGIPQHCMLSPVIGRCRNVQEAVELLGRTVMTGKGQNLVLADAEGNAAAVEKSFDRQGSTLKQADQGAIFLTNHCLTEPLKDTSLGPLTPNSTNRYDNLARQLTAPSYPNALERMQDLFADHAEPGAICQHGQGQLWTLVTSIASPAERTLWVNGDSGCRKSYQEFAL